ncbi:hypothetical protein [Streptomyces sp. NBC_01314]|uniref:hypothetical protein n=1 Tax=Streptomyces sp. NBC_01314 TaxID=2903821 RepID=UPI00308F10A7|nr:hypothetical protein OG622_35590 [Streptomyces sp. NBC_01314]
MSNRQRRQVTPPSQYQGVRERPKTQRSTEEAFRARETGGERTAPGTDPDGTTSEPPSNANEEIPTDVLARPDILFAKLSEKLATKVDKAASKAGQKAAQELSLRLRTQLDESIREAMSTADKMGSVVRQAVQAAVDDALRTAALDETRARERQLAQLALIDRTAHTTQDLKAVRLRVDAEMSRSGLKRVTDPDDLGVFDVDNPAEHTRNGRYEVIVPAYVDTATGRVVQRGTVHHIASPPAADGEDGQDVEAREGRPA